MKNSKLKIAVLGILHFAFCILTCLGDGTPSIPATQLEVNAGTIHNKYVAPDTLAGWPGGGGATNGITPAQYTAGIQSGTNKFSGTSLNLTNSAQSTGINLAVGAHTSDGTPLVLTAFSAGSSDLANLSATDFIFSGLGAGFFYLTSTKAGASVAFATGVMAYDGASPVFTNTLKLAQVLMTTNAFGGTVIDFNLGDATTNLAGDLTFTDVAHVSAGVNNSSIVHLYSGGSTRAIAVPASWHTCTNWVGSLPSGWVMDVLVSVQPGARTNAAQILYP